MYQLSSPVELVRGNRRLLGRGRKGLPVSRTVVMLGLTSLLTDISSEMVMAILPLYLVSVAGLSPLALGLIDGIYNGASSLVRLASGYLGDRRRRHKAVAVLGYGLSAAAKPALLLAGPAVSAIGAIILLDRTGKGLRVAPRDAMISLSTPKESLATAFGVHRAMDTTGALLGPLVAFGLLAAAPLAFESVFLVSFCVAVLGLAVLVLMVPSTRDAAGAPPPPSLRRAAGLVRQPRYRALLLAGAALSLATASDAFIFLILQQHLDLGASLFPLLFVASAGAYMLLAVPMGRLADAFGRERVLLAGYVLLGGVYASLLSPIDGWVLLVVALGLLGAYYAATDGVLMALGSAIVPEDIRGSGLALLGTVTSIARLVASLVFGAVWTLWGADGAVACFAAGLALAIVVAAPLVRGGLTRP